MEDTDSLDFAGDGVTMSAIGLAVTSTIAGSLSTAVYNETPSGTIDGSNTVFTLAHTPSTNRLRLFLNGQRLKEGSDYTLVDLTITFGVAPITGSELLADYDYE